jgi:hypothetical protein
MVRMAAACTSRTCAVVDNRRRVSCDEDNAGTLSAGCLERLRAGADVRDVNAFSIVGLCVRNSLSLTWPKMKIILLKVTKLAITERTTNDIRNDQIIQVRQSVSSVAWALSAANAAFQMLNCSLFVCKCSFATRALISHYSKRRSGPSSVCLSAVALKCLKIYSVKSAFQTILCNLWL